MILVAASTGTEVNSADYIIWSDDLICLEFDFFDLLDEVLCVFDVVGELPTRGFNILANSLATS